MSLKKALFKPAAFYKGILIPLCEVFFISKYAYNYGESGSYCYREIHTFPFLLVFSDFALEHVQAGDCTLKEAVIVSSVLARTSVPALQSAAAMLKIAEMPYNGTSVTLTSCLL